MTEFTTEWIEKVREQIKSISPLPWRACSCGKCGQISNETDCIAIATRGNWGDNYPDIRRISGSIEGKFEVFMNQITYGNIPPETGNANANYIAEACTNYPEALNVIEQLRKENELLQTNRRFLNRDLEKTNKRIAELEQKQWWINQDKTLILKKDGDSWGAVLPDFKDLQQSESRWFSGDINKYIDAVYWFLDNKSKPQQEEE